MRASLIFLLSFFWSIGQLSLGSRECLTYCILRSMNTLIVHFSILYLSHNKARFLLSAYPARKVRLLRENNNRVRYLTQEETKRLLEACPNHLRPMLIVALNTGMRRGEIFNLKWNYIDFNQEIMVFPNSSGDKGFRKFLFLKPMNSESVGYRFDSCTAHQFFPSNGYFAFFISSITYHDFVQATVTIWSQNLVIP